jgi:metal-responsive CopG/Arc/MetJ family transcriptional regulator
MAKVNISLPDGLLDEVDRRADATHTSRSAFMQEAAARYITSLDREAERTARSARIGSAIAKMRDVGSRVPRKSDGTETIRHFRDTPEPWVHAAEDKT